MTDWTQNSTFGGFTGFHYVARNCILALVNTWFSERLSDFSWIEEEGAEILAVCAATDTHRFVFHSSICRRPIFVTSSPRKNGLSALTATTRRL
jgi:hypothetical protein